MSVHPFPPRDAGRVLAAALDAAERAGADEAARRARDIFEPWGGRTDCMMAEGAIRGAALHAAAPLLHGLTADPLMVGILAHGMADEVMIRLRKRGAA